jgi:hypothetical protein
MSNSMDECDYCHLTFTDLYPTKEGLLACSPCYDTYQRACESLMRSLTNGGVCPGCGLIMSVQEGNEQGRCNECLSNHWN